MLAQVARKLLVVPLVLVSTATSVLAACDQCASQSPCSCSKDDTGLLDTLDYLAWKLRPSKAAKASCDKTPNCGVEAPGCGVEPPGCGVEQPSCGCEVCSPGSSAHHHTHQYMPMQQVPQSQVPVYPQPMPSRDSMTPPPVPVPVPRNLSAPIPAPSPQRLPDSQVDPFADDVAGQPTRLNARPIGYQRRLSAPAATKTNRYRNSSYGSQYDEQARVYSRRLTDSPVPQGVNRYARSIPGRSAAVVGASATAPVSRTIVPRPVQPRGQAVAPPSLPGGPAVKRLADAAEENYDAYYNPLRR